MSRKYNGGLIDPSFCCCAVPTVNAGIYAILGEQAIVGVVIGVMALATPDVVGASFPSFAKYILAITCFAVTACQPVGFIGVLREKTSTFKIFLLLNLITVLAAFVTAAALIITSALRHNDAVATCKINYFTPGSVNSGLTNAAANETLTTESNILCKVFTWADVGIMAALWVILFLVQFYFIFVTRRYSTSQVKDHKLYHSVYSENPEAFTMSVLRSSRYNPGSVYSAHPPVPRPADDAWDARPSVESLREDLDNKGNSGYEYATGSGTAYDGHMGAQAHHRGESSGSMLGAQGGYAPGLAPEQGMGMNRASGRYDDADAYDDGYGGQQSQQYQHHQEDYPHYQQDFSQYPDQQQHQHQQYPSGEQGYSQNHEQQLNEYDQAPPYHASGAPGGGSGDGQGYPFAQAGPGYVDHPAALQSGHQQQAYGGYR